MVFTENLGFDFISVFQFKPGMSFDSRPHNPRDYDSFIATVDIDRPGFKWGKLAYSNADIWLFYVKDKDDVTWNTWQSAVFFVNPNDIEQYKITPESFGEMNNFTSLAT